MITLTVFRKPIHLLISILALVTLFQFYVSNSYSATYYVAPPAGGPGGSGTIDDPWHDLNYALNKNANDGVRARVRPGDTLYLRGGVYNINNMTRPSSVATAPMVNLEATTASSATTTIKSYPGEWAILDGYNTTQILQGMYGARQYNIVFENFEVRNGFGAEGCGLVFGNGWDNVWLVNTTFRNLYVHNNGHTGADNNPAGLHLSGDSCTVEYCTFENNGLKDSAGNYITSNNHNVANLILYNNYNSTSGNMDSYPRKNNIIRYNNFFGSNTAIKDKGSSNFVNMLLGYNNALSARHPEWANEIHHNIISGATGQGYYLQQDFVIVHHNIFVNLPNGIICDQVQPTGLAYPGLIWEAQIYNNTFVRNGHDINVWDSPYNYTYGGYNFSIYNNLSIASTGSPFWWFSYRGASSAVWPMIEDHNGFDSSTSKSIGYYQSTYRSLSQWQTIVNPRTGTNTLGSNDIYTSLSVNSDYSLPAASSARGAGRNGADLGAVPSGVSSWYSQAGYQKLSTIISPPPVSIQSVTNP